MSTSTSWHNALTQTSRPTTVLKTMAAKRRLATLAILSFAMAMGTAALATPASAQQVRILRLENIGNDAERNTGVPINTHHCVATGWSARWDTQEDDAGNNYVWTYLKPTTQGNFWHVRASFNSHNDHENMDVDVVCFSTSISTFTGNRFLFHPD
jgi:hypothetical protein